MSKQKTDHGHYCCKEHELLTDKKDRLEGFTNKHDLE